MKKVAVIDYGMGNLHSVAKAVEHIGREQGRELQVQISGDAETILQADHVIFPGVGAIRDCMAEIRRLGIDDIVREVVRAKPLLAICVGMQALLDESEENGRVECLGLIPGRVKFFGDSLRDGEGAKLKVPHMGWNGVRQTAPHPLWEGIEDMSRFYFVHSYYVQVEGEADAEVEAAADVKIAGETVYGQPFTAAVTRGNLFAVQFHPEKSQHAGLRLLSNFLNWQGAQ